MKKKLFLLVMMLLALSAQGTMLVAAERTVLPKGWRRVEAETGGGLGDTGEIEQPRMPKEGVVQRGVNVGPVPADHVRLIAKDGFVFDVPEDIAFVSETIKNTVQPIDEFAFAESGSKTINIKLGRAELDILIRLMSRYAGKYNQRFLKQKKKLAAIINKYGNKEYEKRKLLLEEANFLRVPNVIKYAIADAILEVRSSDPDTWHTNDEVKRIIAKAYFIRERFDKGDLKAVPLKLAFNYGFSIHELSDLGFTPGVTEVKLGMKNMLIRSLDGLQDIPELGTVSSLYLDSNQISELRAETFAGLEKLGVLSLKNNRISELPEGVFKNMGSLGSISLDSNQISELRADMLTGLENLSALSLKDNRISELPEDVFKERDFLRKIDLDSNQIRELPENIFEEQKYLKYLNLRNNEISELPENVFRENRRLRFLYLDSNQISELRPETFAGLRGLRKLSLRENLLSKQQMEQLLQWAAQQGRVKVIF